MTITEPMTMATDYLITIFAFIWGIGMVRKNTTLPGRAVRFWAGALIFIGIGAATGGTFHGFQMTMPAWAVEVTWKATMVAIGAASFCFAAATIFTAFSHRVRRILLAIVAVKLAVYLVWLWAGDDNFKYAIYEYSPAMTAVLIIQLYLWLKRKDPAASWIVAGVAVSFLAAFIQMFEFGLHKHFNHNDIYHLVQIVGLYLFYRGGILVADHAAGDPLE
jgi:hypothetical protein